MVSEKNYARPFFTDFYRKSRIFARKKRSFALRKKVLLISRKKGFFTPEKGCFVSHREKSLMSLKTFILSILDFKGPYYHMYKKEKASVALGARLANLSLYTFIYILSLVRVIPCIIWEVGVISFLIIGR